MHIVNTISKNITDTNGIKKCQSILISVSGGQDSICVFFIFIQLKKQWHWSFGVIYCNHLWQKSSFVAGSLIVKITYFFKIPIYYGITANAVFNEQNSRYWRYKVFYRLVFFYNYKILITGHTSNDKIETILFQLIRGASGKSFLCLNTIKQFSCNTKFAKTSKVSSISFFYKKKKTEKFFRKHKKNVLITRGIFLVLLKDKTEKLFRKHKKNVLITRPILQLKRFDLRKFLLFFNLPLYPDSSNQNILYYRNRIRKQLIPTLKFFFNRQISISVSQFYTIIFEEQFHLNLLIKELVLDFNTITENFFIINTNQLIKLPINIQRKLIKQLLQQYSITKKGFNQIEKILKSLHKKKKKIVYESITFKNLPICYILMDHIPPYFTL